MLNPIIFALFTLAAAGLDLTLAVRAYRKGTATGKYLCCTFVGAAVTNISYLFSVFSRHYFLMSFCYSIYFASIDLMLFSLLDFVNAYIKQKDGIDIRHIRNFLKFYTIVDLTIIFINPFKEISVHYVYMETYLASYTFEMLPLYNFHLILTYMMVVLALYRLIQKVHHTPSVYHKQYMMSVIGIILVVLYNAIFLFSSRSYAYDFLDYSIWGYSFCAFFLYWNCFNYTTNGMMNYFRNWILENVNQGIILFDYENNIIAKNEQVKKLFPSEAFHSDITLEEFLEICHIQPDKLNMTTNHSFQCFKKNGDSLFPVRCDYRPLKSSSREILGKLFVFTDNTYELDLLTGFHSWEFFQKTLLDNEAIGYPLSITVSICDINGLQNINDTLGRNTGDQAIAILAATMQKHFPPDTYFIRGHEASLIALCFGDHTEETMQIILNQIQSEYNSITELGCLLDVQSSVCKVSSEQPDIITAVHTAERSMKAKKLMDKNSSHSELMTSLICALQESDNDTEAHVQRTQIIGEKLAHQMGLSAIQKSNLSLLCILHDIGKIGIPLEILNKPGKLTSAEWAVLKTHVEKGYQIVKSSQELSSIADMVLHHHERWDGKGYPDGLSKESIPLLARIISVIDAYDAMVNNRSYRSAISSEKAVEELIRCAGTQFDPTIVSEFVQLLEKDPSIAALSASQNTNTTPVVEERPPHVASLPNDVPVKNNYMIHPVKFSRYLLDEEMYIVSGDANFEALTGYTLEDALSLKLQQTDLIFSNEREEYLRIVGEQLSQNDVAFFEHRLRRKDGSATYVFCFGKPFYDSASRSGKSEIIITDCSDTYTVRTILNEEQNKAQIRLTHWEKKYRCDSLTGLLSHEAFRNDVSEKMLSAGQKIMMLMMDIDKFKEYNDVYGHHKGDEFLILVAQTLTNSLRKEDYACRMGGDEFAAVLFYSDSIADEVMMERAQQICDKLNLTLSAQKGGTSLSMGAAIFSPELNTFTKLYEAADKALYHSKENGRAILSVYQK